MAHLAARGGRALAVQVNLHRRVKAQGGPPPGLAAGPEIAQEIDHGGGHDQVAATQGQIAECSDLLLELANRGSLEGQVPRVVRPGSELVNQQAAALRQEELDTKDPDGPQRLGHGQGQRAGLESDDRSHGGRHHRRVQDVPLMVVQADRIGHRVAVLPASHDHRDLGGELDPALGHAGNPAQAGPRGGRLGRLRDQHLPLAVVPRAGGFQDQGETEALHRRHELDLGPDRPPGGVRDGVAGQKALLAQPVLAGPDGSPSRPDDSPSRQPSQGRGRDILELDGDRLGRGGDGAERRKVIGSADHRPVGHLGGGCVLGGAQDARPVAHPLRGLDEHPSQLPAADDAQRCRWIDNRTSPPVLGLIDGRTRAGAGAGAHTGDSPTASV